MIWSWSLLEPTLASTLWSLKKPSFRINASTPVVRAERRYSIVDPNQPSVPSGVGSPGQLWIPQKKIRMNIPFNSWQGSQHRFILAVFKEIILERLSFLLANDIAPGLFKSFLLRGGALPGVSLRKKQLSPKMACPPISAYSCCLPP